MNCYVQQRITPFMSSELSKEEVEAMIEAGVARGVSHGMDEWQGRYGLKPEHWVFLKTKYMESKATSRTMKDNIINALTNGVIMLIMLGVVTFLSKALGGE